MSNHSSSKDNKRKSGAFNSSHANKVENSDSIHVVCRFRPPKKSEVELYGQSSTVDSYAIHQESGFVEVMMDAHEKKTFTFDRV